MLIKALCCFTMTLLSFIGGSKRKRFVSRALVVFVSIPFLLVSCGDQSASFTSADRRTADSVVLATHGTDSLAMLQKQLEIEGNHLGSIRLELSRNKEQQLSQLRTVLERYQSSTLSGRKELLQSIISDIQYTKEKKTKPADFALSIKLKDFI